VSRVQRPNPGGITLGQYLSTVVCLFLGHAYSCLAYRREDLVKLCRRCGKEEP
jgi:hypothetical protein